MENASLRPLLTQTQLLTWLGVSEFWLRDRMKNDPGFPVIDLAPKGARKRTRRYDAAAIARHLGMPEPTWIRPPQQDPQAA